jgi:microcystin-dependent protein
MSQPFVAEIRIFPYNFAPKAWAFCDGQLLSISQNSALFSLLGTSYGGDGRSTFGLPNLEGSVAIHTDQYSGGGSFFLGQAAGEDTVTLLNSEMPAHSHLMQGDTSAFDTALTSPGGGVPGRTPVGTLIYSTNVNPVAVTMNPAMISIAGGSQPHNNLMPYLVLNYCIALQGIYPARP